MSSSSNNIILTIVFSALGGVIVLLTDFAGWTENTFYGFNDYYVFIGSENAPAFGQLLVALIGLGLLAIAFLSYQQLNIHDTEKMKQTYLLSLGILVLTILSAILFVIMAWDAVESWLDTGFYAALVGSATSLFFTRQAMK